MLAIGGNCDIYSETSKRIWPGPRRQFKGDEVHTEAEAS